ncbi:VOC family protein [Actibacterium sp. 188UL27-1]|uniref:VOC family protein n=1 Tax=Actibacterium sp. 188UL27-1 TaxID=2786961 RepID=UPI00195AC5FE|nr:VOC family protein [Actibacterium sp. 188UL27-1]MBM7066973.1 VOC family protein [Actibacterium sp. 188UL27-1]
MTYRPKNFTVWAEIPVTDMDRSMAFYNAVTHADLQIDGTEPNPMAMFKTGEKGGIAGHLYPGIPAKQGEGPTIHLTAPGTLEEIIARIWDAGGKVVSPPIEIPAGRFAYAIDPDGNSIGFFEGKD